jgi:tRNA (cytidine/uridine-2'-O-)-methyltransferase
MRLALFQPDIPQNTGTLLRLAACLGVPVDVILPAGFDLSDRALKRAALDYLPHVELTRHVDWAAFEAGRRVAARRLILLTTRATRSHLDLDYQHTDVLLLGRESAGVPEIVHQAADVAVKIPLQPALRSLNVAVAGAIVLAEALRQTGGFPAQDAADGNH